MEETLQRIRERFVRDLYVSQGLGAVIEEASSGYARCVMEIEARHCTALGIPMGGAVFTLGDFAFAVASNQNGREIVTQASQITFLKPARGKRLIAEARQIKNGRHVCFYEITVRDNLGTEVAFMTLNGFVVKNGDEEGSP